MASRLCYGVGADHLYLCDFKGRVSAVLRACIPKLIVETRLRWSWVRAALYATGPVLSVQDTSCERVPIDPRDISPN